MTLLGKTHDDARGSRASVRRVTARPSARGPQTTGEASRGASCPRAQLSRRQSHVNKVENERQAAELLTDPGHDRVKTFTRKKTSQTASAACLGGRSLGGVRPAHPSGKTPTATGHVEQSPGITESWALPPTPLKPHSGVPPGQRSVRSPPGTMRTQKGQGPWFCLQVHGPPPPAPSTQGLEVWSRLHRTESTVG